ncbi:MAG: iron-containing alcohol dehydrogenase [Candidatus Moranbacteria bacterium]|nr:iron-containing alcohol dehydrogenase [Candidatus Moranbacteria bacterium]
MKLKYFEFYNPVKILSGSKALENIPTEMEYLNAARPFIITDQGIVKTGLIKLIKSFFKADQKKISFIFDKTPADSSLTVVKKLADIFRKKNCDCLVAVGGGSVIDTAKGVNILVGSNKKDLSQLVGVNNLKFPQKPLIVVPTTSGTGSEATQAAVIYDEKQKIKLSFTSPTILPKTAVLDPRSTLSLPPLLTAATGMDALTHAVEAYSCLQKNPLSDVYAKASLEFIGKFFIKAVKKPHNKQARMGMANASLMAGIAFSSSMVGAVHALGHALGAVAGLHHGNAMAILLPLVMQANLDKIGDIYGQLLLPLAGEKIYRKTPQSKRAQRMIDHIKSLNKKLNRLTAMPITLAQAGVKRKKLDQVARKALDDGTMALNPKDFEIEEIVKILNQAY